jgi:hypothetical protein
MADSSQVFISYQRSDEAFARQVREHLVAAGVQTWMDQFDIPVGAYWPDEIDRGLSASDIVVGVLSPDAVESRNVKNEWDWALQNHKQLLLLLVKPTIVPHRYVSINFIDVSNGSLAPALEGLMLTLGARVAPTAVGPPPATPPATTRHANRGDRRRRRVVPVVAGRHADEPWRTGAAGR